MTKTLCRAAQDHLETRGHGTVRIPVIVTARTLSLATSLIGINSMKRKWMFVGCFLMRALLNICRADDLVYKNPPDVHVRGQYWNDGGRIWRVQADELNLDLNGDGQDDLLLRHDLVPRQQSLDGQAVNMLQTGEERIAEMRRVVQGLRALTIDALNQGYVQEKDWRSDLSRQVDTGIEALREIATRPYDGEPLLDGTRGYAMTATSSYVQPILATADTYADSYTVEVTTTGERATITAGTPQLGHLASDETLMINDVEIRLDPDMLQYQVIDRINEYESQTGIVADQFMDATRISTTRYGAGHSDKGDIQSTSRGIHFRLWFDGEHRRRGRCRGGDWRRCLHSLRRYCDGNQTDGEGNYSANCSFPERSHEHGVRRLGHRLRGRSIPTVRSRRRDR